MQQKFAENISEVIERLSQKHQEELAKKADEISVLHTEIKLVEEQKA